MSINRRMLISHVLLLLLAINLIDANKVNNGEHIYADKRAYDSEFRPLSPVILVPGVGGNRLHAKLDKTEGPHMWCRKQTSYYDLWLDPTQFIPASINCWVDNMKLRYDNVSRTTLNTEGVDIKLPPWGRTDELEYLDSSIASPINKFGVYYYYIVAALVKRGYVKGTTLFGAPYDFRKGPNEQQNWFKKLKATTEYAYTINDETKVTFIVHSLGGKMILHFLQRMPQSWKDQYVNRVISLNGAFGGSIKSLLAVSTGYNMDSSLVSSAKMKEVQSTLSSVAWLMPSDKFWGPNEVLATIGQTEYTVQNIDQFLYAFGVPHIVEIRKDQAKYNNFTAPGVEMHCLIGKDVTTPEKLMFDSIKSEPKIAMGDGDGTVNMRGLLACQMWKDTPSQGKYAVYHREFTGVEHFDIMGNAEIINYISETLTGQGAYSNVNEISGNPKIMKIRLI